MKETSIIDVNNITFEYPSAEEGGTPVSVLRAMSLEIKEGSFTAVLGRNGSGKSTFSKHLNALLVPSEGQVVVCGMDTADDDNAWEIRKNAGMVFQNPDNQIVAAIVEDDVAFALENIGLESAEIRKRIDEAMKRTGVYELRKKSPHMLSGGQKQRVAIAGATAMKPRCIIFDEPTAMLDPQGRDEVISLIHSLKDDGITIIMITHFMEEAADADRVVVMNDGCVMLDGTPEDVFLETEKIEKAGLSVPSAVKIADKMRAGGIEIPANIIRMDELANFAAKKIAEAESDEMHVIDFAEMRADFAEDRADCAEMSVDCTEMSVDCTEMSVDCAEDRADCAEMSVDCAEMSVDCAEMSADCAEMSVDCTENGAEHAEKHTETTKENIIELKNVNYTYNKNLPDETYALHDVSFSIERGSFTGIIGHTGSGKSTLIQMLDGLLKPDSGSIFVEGCDITLKNGTGGMTMRELRQKIGLVFQYPEYQLFEETVAKDVSFGPRNAGLSEEEIDKRTREAFRLAGLAYDEIAEKSPFDLSGGQKRKAAIAGVLAMRPEILVLDEPTAGLDPATHRDILKMIDEINKTLGTTIIMISHNMDDVASMCDHVLVINGGEIILDGSPEYVYSNNDILQRTGLKLPCGAQLFDEIGKLLEKRGVKLSLDEYCKMTQTKVQTAAKTEPHCENAKSAAKTEPHCENAKSAAQAEPHCENAKSAAQAELHCEAAKTAAKTAAKAESYCENAKSAAKAESYCEAAKTEQQHDSLHMVLTADDAADVLVKLLSV